MFSNKNTYMNHERLTLCFQDFFFLFFNIAMQLPVSNQAE